MTLLEAARAAAPRLVAASRTGSTELWAAHTGDALAATGILARAWTRQGLPFHARLLPFHGAGAEEPLDADVPALRAWIALAPPRTTPPGAELVVGVAQNGNAPHRTHLASSTDSFPDAALAAFALAVAIDEKNWDLAPVALAIDPAMRTPGTERHGWGPAAVDEAVRRGHAARSPGLLLQDLPLLDLLAHPDQRLPSSAGYEEASRWLERWGLPPDATPHELTHRDRQTFANALAIDHLRSDRPPQDLARMFGPILVDPHRDGLPLVRIASLLDAAAREDEPGAALAWCLGDEPARADLEKVEAQARRRLREILQDAVAPRRDGRGFGRLPITSAPYLDRAAPLLARRFPPGDGCLLVEATHDGHTLIAPQASTPRVQGAFAGAASAEGARIASMSPLLLDVATPGLDSYLDACATRLGTIPVRAPA